MNPFAPYEPTNGAPWLLALARVFERSQTPVYLVGGGVRNALMGLPASDIDVCGPARPEAVEALCAGTEVRAVARAAHFGTVELHDGDHHMAEYTTFRVDSYRGGHSPAAVRFADTAEVDALRRDFSVNAMYRQLTTEGCGSLIDPTGGEEHLRAGILHTVTPDPDQVLKDDGLRILRAARFQAELDLAPTEMLLASAARHAPLLLEIARERLHDELVKILRADLRYPSLPRRVHPVRAGLETLRTVGAWDALFGTLGCDEPALDAQARYAAPEGVNPLSGRMALLFEHASPDALQKAMQSLHFAVREIDEAARLLRAQQQAQKGRLSAFDAAQLGPFALRHLCAAFAALRNERGLALAQERHDASAHWPLSLRQLAVRGDDLLLLCKQAGAPSREIGRTLQTLWQQTVEDGLPNQRESLLTAARRLLGDRQHKS